MNDVKETSALLAAETIALADPAVRAQITALGMVPA